jgi:hypothetical protein
VDGLDYEVSLNGNLIHQDQTSKASASKRTVHEMFTADQIKTGTNRLKFEVKAGTGIVRISDIYLMYHKQA